VGAASKTALPFLRGKRMAGTRDLSQPTVNQLGVFPTCLAFRSFGFGWFTTSSPLTPHTYLTLAMRTAHSVSWLFGYVLKIGF